MLGFICYVLSLPGRADGVQLSTPVANLSRSPLAPQGSSGAPASRQRVDELKGADRSSRVATSIAESDDEQAVASDARPSPTRYSGTVVRLQPALDEAVAAGSLAATASAARVDANTPMRCRVTLGDDLSFSSEESPASSSASSPREQSRELPEEQPGHPQEPAQYEPRRKSHGLAAVELPRRRVVSPTHYTLPASEPPQIIKGSADFPPPHSMTEMQRRMEEEWAERERRLRLQHQRHTEAVVAQEVDKVRFFHIACGGTPY